MPLIVTKCFVKEGGASKIFQKFKTENSYFEKISVELNLSFEIVQFVMRSMTLNLFFKFLFNLSLFLGHF